MEILKLSLVMELSKLSQRIHNMFALQNRGGIPERVSREFENFMSRLRKLWLTEHDEDGTHQGVTYSGTVSSITIVNGIVTEVEP